MPQKDLDISYFWTTAQAAIEKAYQDGKLKIAIMGNEHEVEGIYFDSDGKIGIKAKI